MNKNKFSDKYILLIVKAAAILYTLFFIYFIFISFLNYDKASKQLKERQAQLSRLEKDIRDIKLLLVRYQKEKERFKTLLFKDQDIPTFLEEISGFARNSQVGIANLVTKSFKRVESYQAVDSSLSTMEKAKLNKGEQETGPVLMYLPIQITIHGKFGDIVNFLFYLEKYKQLLTLADVEINVKQYPLLESDFVINIYSLKESQEPKEK